MEKIQNTTIANFVAARIAPKTPDQAATDEVRYTIFMKESHRDALNALAKRTGTGAIKLASEIFELAFNDALKAVEEADKAAAEAAGKKEVTL